MMKHQTRLKLILGAIVVDLVAICVAVALGASAEVLVAVCAPLGVLAPALADAGAVEKRRRDPKRPAVSDDILG